MTTTTTTPTRVQCSTASTATGRRCQLWATGGDEFCHMHRPRSAPKRFDPIEQPHPCRECGRPARLVAVLAASTSRLILRWNCPTRGHRWTETFITGNVGATTVRVDRT